MPVSGIKRSDFGAVFLAILNDDMTLFYYFLSKNTKLQHLPVISLKYLSESVQGIRIVKYDIRGFQRRVGYVK